MHHYIDDYMDVNMFGEVFTDSLIMLLTFLGWCDILGLWGEGFALAFLVGHARLFSFIF